MKRYLKIKSMMVRAGVKNADIAATAGVKPCTVSIVLTGRQRSKNIETAIAESLGKTRDELWPVKANAAA